VRVLLVLGLVVLGGCATAAHEIAVSDETADDVRTGGARDETFRASLGPVLADRVLPSARGLASIADGRTFVLFEVGGPGHRHSAIVALRPDGAVDASFGAGGVFEFGGDQSFPYGLVAQADGRLVVYGNKQYGNAYRTTLWRVAPSGTLDPSFGDGGAARIEIDTAETGADEAWTALAAGDRILVGGRAERDGWIARVTGAGRADPTFHGGRPYRIAGKGESIRIASLALRKDGAILATGNVGRGSSGATMVFGVDPNGGALAGFGAAGTAPTDLGGGIGNDFLGGATVLDDGSVIVAASDARARVGIRRLEPDGTNDAAFFPSLRAPRRGFFGRIEPSAGGRALLMWWSPEGCTIARTRRGVRALDVAFGRDGVVEQTLPDARLTSCAFTQQRDGRILVLVGGAVGPPQIVRYAN
jgi:uncharacterized delta-60 repeat protein